MRPYTINWLAALCVALLLSTSYLLDGPTDAQAAQAVADDLADAQQSAQASATKSIAAKAVNTWATGQFDQRIASAKGARP